MAPRYLIYSAAIAAFALANAPGAQAATVQETAFSGELEVLADPGEANEMTITVTPGAGNLTDVTVADDGVAPVAGAGCSGGTGGSVECEADGLYIIFVELGDEADALAVENTDPGVQLTIGMGDGGDSASVGPQGEVCLSGGPGDDELEITTPSAACTVDGDQGEDTLTGSAGYDLLYGGDGVDVVRGGGGPDYVYGDDEADDVHGGPGDDRVRGGAGDDDLDGGAGEDSFSDDAGDDGMHGGRGDDRFYADFRFGSGDDRYAGGRGLDELRYLCPECEVTLDGIANDGRAGQGERDNVATESVAVESHTPRGDEIPPHNYGSGDDFVLGDGEANRLDTFRGADFVLGGGGRDRLRAGPGRDFVHAADGSPDAVVACGPGEDDAVVDPTDTHRGCEHVRRVG